MSSVDNRIHGGHTRGRYQSKQGWGYVMANTYHTSGCCISILEGSEPLPEVTRLNLRVKYN